MSAVENGAEESDRLRVEEVVRNLRRASLESAVWEGIAEFQQEVDHALLHRIGCMVVDHIRARGDRA